MDPFLPENGAFIGLLEKTNTVKYIKCGQATVLSEHTLNHRLRFAKYKINDKALCKWISIGSCKVKDLAILWKH